MDVLRWLVFGVLPAVAVVLVGVGIAGPRLLAPSLALAVCVPWGMLGDWPAWPWQLSLRHGEPSAWTWWVIAAAGVVGGLRDGRLLPRALLLPLEVTIVAALPWLVTADLRRGWTFEQTVVWLGAGWLVTGATWWVLRQAAKLQPGMAVPAAGALVLLADTLVLHAAGATLAWQLASVGAIALGMAVATALWRRPFVCGTGGTLAVVAVHTGLLTCGRSETELTRPATLLVLVALLPMVVVASRPFVDGRTTGAVLGVLGTAAVAAAAVLAA